MNLGIIGLPQSGKKTIFKLLTGQSADKAASKHGIRYGIAPVKDPRIDRLSEMYQPKKTRYAEFEIALPPDITPNAARTADWLEPLRKVDAFLHVVRAFEDPGIYHVEGDVNPERDVTLVDTEILLADLDLVEKRLERLRKETKKNDVAGRQQLEVLEKCRDALEAEQPLRSADLSDDDMTVLQNLQLLTLKPVTVVFNIGDDFDKAVSDLKELEENLTGRQETTIVYISAGIESEIIDLDEAEQESFMEDMGVKELASHRLSRAAYQSLGLISFFTVGPDEVRAWPVREGAAAPEAAGKVHSDIQRGFIRAETVAYGDLIEAGSEAEAKKRNVMRAQGKDYVVKSGDVINFRFNV